MTLNKRAREQMLAHCGEIHEDDGIDPRDYFKLSRTGRKENTKARQLSRQVAETIDQVLSGETEDDHLASLGVVSVVPAPDSSRLLVTLHADLPPEAFDRALIVQKLARYQRRLRWEVAAAITRRKTPTLAFQVIGPEGDFLGPGKEGMQ